MQHGDGLIDHLTPCLVHLEPDIQGLEKLFPKPLSTQ